jgi:hypothetical protein
MFLNVLPSIVAHLLVSLPLGFRHFTLLWAILLYSEDVYYSGAASRLAQTIFHLLIFSA